MPLKIRTFRIEEIHKEKISTLVSMGFFTSNGDFVRKAVRNLLENLYSERGDGTDDFIATRMDHFPILYLVDKVIEQDIFSSRQEFMKVSIVQLLKDYRDELEHSSTFDLNRFLVYSGLSTIKKTDFCLLCRRKIKRGKLCQVCIQELN